MKHEDEKHRHNLKILQVKKEIKMAKFDERLGVEFSLREWSEDEERGYRRGGRFLSEKHDHFYQCHFLTTNNPDEKDQGKIIENCRLLKLMKGMHRHPEIPVVCANGLASVDLEAARTFFSTAFDFLECKLQPG
jgi:hypothetical protein